MLSRCRVIALNGLTSADLVTVLRRALATDPYLVASAVREGSGSDA